MSTPLNATTYLQQTLAALWENLPNVALGGLLFSLFCVPGFLLFVLGWVTPALITVPLLVAPAWSALMRMQATLLAEKTSSISEMGRAFAQYWRSSFRLGVIGIVPVYLLTHLLPVLGAPTVSWMVWVALVLLLFGTAFVGAIFLYAFPLTILYEAPTMVVLRNSAILASRHAGNSVGLLSMGVLFALGVGYLSLALLFVLPTVYAWFIVNHCRMVVGEGE